MERRKKAGAAHLKKTRKLSKNGDWKEPRNLPPEEWKVNVRGAMPTLEIRGDSLAVGNWLNGTSKVWLEAQFQTSTSPEQVVATVANMCPSGGQDRRICRTMKMDVSSESQRLVVLGFSRLAVC